MKEDPAGDLTLNKLLIEGEGWQTLAEGMGFADGLSGDTQGNLYTNDLKSGGYWRIAPDAGLTHEHVVRPSRPDETKAGTAFLRSGRLWR